ncbi:hypothetical protein CJU94_33535 (plasmid) [Paraburkholderia aromaticivorans]|uniref:Uncharacterized protein n=1 Tax=Paraburkholderia aromaticivorans TaxID=2026199 RepID=A0A248VX83_9BURK|nr:hypothetical protein CJU94_33535 [Paraburkholderia aromaticivorans]
MLFAPLAFDCARALKRGLMGRGLDGRFPAKVSESCEGLNPEVYLVALGNFERHAAMSMLLENKDFKARISATGRRKADRAR